MKDQEGFQPSEQYSDLYVKKNIFISYCHEDKNWLKKDNSLFGSIKAQKYSLMHKLHTFFTEALNNERTKYFDVPCTNGRDSNL
ncbi:MAG: hypothetical protein OMM_07971 [Candidatus Magnetoglobus multicellularis str. Araruama]|uniref:Uncharacterized protein n=1 Tax=Candidatus Magnetoglobus multicellularis str. Araruama TaxID=890399 RepID=A0A1V1P9T2_9BACT|nr:MAG: hypothetical protein OMM_07971 [Candidatus Magnetoglobus multicellularis str. Araruama]